MPWRKKKALSAMVIMTTLGGKKMIDCSGCMPPEYYMDGKDSVKSDVYSFGIILLEIISGKRMFSLYLSRSLVDEALSMWDERLYLVNDSLGGAFQGDEVTRCIDVYASNGIQISVH